MDAFFLHVRLHVGVVQVVVEVDFVVATHVTVQAEVVASTSDPLRSRGERPIQNRTHRHVGSIHD